MNEYLSVLRPLLDNGTVDFAGRFYNVKGQFQVPGATPIPVAIAALAPRMLRIAGEQADGTIAWMSGVKTIESHVVPRISAASQAVNKPLPRVCVGMPISVTDDTLSARDAAAGIYQHYGQLANYRRMVDLEGVEGPSEVALIRGGARGQGAAEARMFALEGAKVILGDVLDDEGKKVEAQIRELGGEATYVHLDVTKEPEWQDAVSTAVRTYGKLNVLVNNAGILIRKNIEETTVEDWDRIFDINANGVFLGTKASIPAMREAGGGSIVNISSTAGLVSSPSGSASYTATKGAVRLFTKATAIQYAKEGIRCNSVNPGPIETEMLQDSLNDPAAMELRMQRLPTGRIGKPEEVAYRVNYLASDESSFVTGSELVIDGGTTAQ